MENVMKNISQVVAVATAGLLSFSIIHDYFYFRIVGKKFFSMMGTWDHVSSALENTVMFLMWYFIVIVYRSTTSATPSNTAMAKIRNVVLDQVPPFIGIAMFVASLFFETNAAILSSMAILFMAPIWSWLFFVHLKIMDQYRAFVGMTFFLMMASVIMAEYKANIDLYSINSIDAKYVHNGVEYKVLKSFASGYVVRSLEADEVKFFSWDQSVIFTSSFVNTNKGYACKQFGWCV